ncbi:hypothetical protein AB0H00_28920 [Nocardia sp. NPDC023852]|uniref:hypothetical protein n=1 Tax=Nocardia sp. NPDC023852 TaxID=3154697 RepID=UPI00340DB618
MSFDHGAGVAQLACGTFGVTVGVIDRGGRAFAEGPRGDPGELLPRAPGQVRPKLLGLRTDPLRARNNAPSSWVELMSPGP